MEHLRMKAAAGNEAAIAHLASVPQPESLLLWTAFWDLNDFRAVTNEGPKRIQLDQILAYAEYRNLSTPGLRRRLLAAVRLMDSTYLDWIRRNG